MVEPGSPVRIALVSDDDALIRHVVRMALDSDGWTVLEAADVATEFDALERHDVELCIMDRHMPGPDLEARIDTVARRRPGAAILVLSGDGERALRDGVVHLAKPVELQVLRDGVARALAATAAQAGRARP